MREIGAFDAKTHFSEILTEVESGAEVTITRRGVPVARIVPVQNRQQEEAMAAVVEADQIRARLAARGIRVTTKEICEMVHEGRR